MTNDTATLKTDAAQTTTQTAPTNAPSTTPPPVAVTNLTITCADGHQLAATQYTPHTPPHAAVMIAPATAILRHFYHDFAHWLAGQGYTVMTYDNRGIGGSLSGHVRDNNATIAHWGQLDAPAIAAHLESTTNGLPLHLIGHSAGGQTVGLMPNHHLLASILNISCTSGSIKLMNTQDKPKSHFFVGLFMPLSRAILGYAPNQLLGMGEPIPAGVARQWSTIGRGTGYAEALFGTDINQHWYADITAPSMWLNATDDFLAGDKNLADITRLFTNSPTHTIKLQAGTPDNPKIGHMGFFTTKNQNLWHLATDWIATNTPRPETIDLREIETKMSRKS